MKALTAVMVFVFGVTVACAGAELDLLPALKLRTLKISPDFAGFEYQYEVCVSQFIWCTHKEIRKDTYDLNDLAIRAKLRDMGFVAQVLEQR